MKGLKNKLSTHPQMNCDGLIAKEQNKLAVSYTWSTNRNFHKITVANF